MNAFENGEDYVLLGSQMGLGKSTTRNIIHRYLKTNQISKGQRGGSKGKLTHETKEAILEKLDSNPFLTLRDLVAFVKVYNGTTCCMGTISNFLHKQMISFKSARGSVEDKNSVRVKTMRKEYVEKFLNDGWRMRELVYIDESSFNLWMHSRKGWNKVGQRLNVKLPNCHGPTISLVMAIGKNGPIHFKLRKGTYNRETYTEFITELNSKLDANSKYYLIHDNAPIHFGLTTGNANHIISHLPPYSPFLNPIEAVFSKLKAHVRKEMTVRMESSGQSIESKIQNMMQVIASEISKPDYLNMAPFFRHIKKFFVRSILLEDIFGD